MKVLSSIFIIFAAVNFSIAEKLPSDSTFTSKKNNSYSKYEFFFQAGYVTPVGSFGDDFYYNRSLDIKYSLQKSIEGDGGGFNAQSTLSMETGITIFTSRKPPKANFGIRTVLFSYSSFPFRWEGDSDLIYTDATYQDLKIISIKTGPIVRFYNERHLHLDLYYNIGIAFGSHASWDYYDNYDEFKNGLQYQINDHANFKLNSGSGWMHETGVILSYRAFKTGVSFNFGSIRYKNIEIYRHSNILLIDVNSNTGHSYSLYDDEALDLTAPVSYFKFFVGVRLGK